MPSDHEPVTLELAQLPREQVGPFLLLGVDKDADAEQIEASWAQRLIWARKHQIPTPLGDINWAREEINDPERRVRAHLTSLNADTGERLLSRLAGKYGVDAWTGPAWQALEIPPSVVDDTLAADVPDAQAIEASIVLPDIPEEMPAVASLLERFLQQPLHPWAVDFAAEFHQDKPV
jgi:hypothetical protein